MSPLPAHSSQEFGPRQRRSSVNLKHTLRIKLGCTVGAEVLVHFLFLIYVSNQKIKTDLTEKPELHGPHRSVGGPRRQVPLHELHAVM